MGWTQSRGSKIEHGMIEIERGEEATRLAELLDYPQDLLFLPAKVLGFATCCLYHRKRAGTPVKALKQLHDRVNIRRIQLGRLVANLDLPNEQNFPSLDIDEYDSPEQIAQLLRGHWKLPRGPITNLIDAVESAGGLVFIEPFETTKVDAVSQQSNDVPPLFFLNSDKSFDRCRYTLAHEIGHIVMHRFPTPDAESEADRFAAELLMPAREIASELKGLNIHRATLLKSKWRVSVQALIRRARDTRAITESRYKSLCVRVSQLGYRKNEPNPILPESPTAVSGIVHEYLRNRDYTLAELSAAALCEENEFRELFVARDEPNEGPELRLFT